MENPKCFALVVGKEDRWSVVIAVQGVDGMVAVAWSTCGTELRVLAVVDQELGCRQKRDVTRPGT